jgi:hypothetical protein
MGFHHFWEGLAALSMTFPLHAHDSPSYSIYISISFPLNPVKSLYINMIFPQYHSHHIPVSLRYDNYKPYAYYTIIFPWYY